MSSEFNHIMTKRFWKWFIYSLNALAQFTSLKNVTQFICIVKHFVYSELQTAIYLHARIRSIIICFVAATFFLHIAVELWGIYLRETYFFLYTRKDGTKVLCWVT